MFSDLVILNIVALRNAKAKGIASVQPYRRFNLFCDNSTYN